MSWDITNCAEFHDTPGYRDGFVEVSFTVDKWGNTGHTVVDFTPEQLREFLEELAETIDCEVVDAEDDEPTIATDGGRDQGGEYYVVDETRAAVVDGPFESKDAAVGEAHDAGPHHIVATEGSLELIEMTSNTSITWETDDDVATDGGLEEVFRRETLVETDDGMAVGEDAVPNHGSVSQTGPGEIHKSDGMRCHECGNTHDDWSKDGEHAVDDGSHCGIIERWECGICGAITEGGRR